ncbi:MAG: hypothetical protein SFZ02_15565 [bacterium]|nr:hypothetical protein [bacterium]
MRLFRFASFFVVLFMLTPLFIAPQPAHATAQTAFSSTYTWYGGYNTAFYQFGFSFLTNSTTDEIVGLDLILSSSSPMTLNLYTSDATGNQGTFITTIATQNVGTFGLHTFTPTTPILLQPNSYYWIQTEATTGGIAVGDQPTSDYYTYIKGRLYDISSATWFDIPGSPRPTLRVDSLDPLSASATCLGNDLVVTIPTGDGDFEIRDDSGLLMGNATTGVNTITGPINASNITVTETRGDQTTLPVGSLNCYISEELSASTACMGNDLLVIIGNGNAPFNLSVNGALVQGGVGVGFYYVPDADIFANITVQELAGDSQTLTLPDTTCPTPLAVNESPAVGCEFVGDVDIFASADNTYCRTVMKNGAVTGYAGAVPQDLINLGVILAVDVYRMQGGQSITEFGGYTQICLAGTGRLFYLDARTSPRTINELITENINGMTCGWIPAVGTLVLTN